AMPMSTRTSVASQKRRIRAACGCGEEPMGNISGLPPQVGSRGEHSIDNHVANPRRQRSLWRRGVGVWVVPLPPFVRRGLRVPLGRVLPRLPAPERRDVEVVPGAPRQDSVVIHTGHISHLVHAAEPDRIATTIAAICCSEAFGEDANCRPKSIANASGK